MKSTKKCSVVENGSCLALNNVEVMKRALGPYPIQDIFDGLLAPEGISNHMTDILLFNTILALGWIFGGKKKWLLKNHIFTFCQIIIQPTTDFNTEFEFWQKVGK